MKQFIVLVVILPILLLFMAQSTLDAGRSLRVNAAEDAVRTFCMEASYYGPADTEALRAKLANIFSTDINEIYIDLAKTDDAHIDWIVSFPVGDIMAGAGFMGLDRAENRGRAQMSGTIVVAPPQLQQQEENAVADPDPDDF